jgi:hypothetical protein
MCIHLWIDNLFDLMGTLAEHRKKKITKFSYSLPNLKLFCVLDFLVLINWNDQYPDFLGYISLSKISWLKNI